MSAVSGCVADARTLVVAADTMVDGLLSIARDSSVSVEQLQALSFILGEATANLRALDVEALETLEALDEARERRG